MKTLLDTNVLSETSRPVPDLRVLHWLDALDEDQTVISVITIAEIRRGIAFLVAGRRRNLLAEWLTGDLVKRFDGRIIPVDPAVALAWGDLMGQAKRLGRGLGAMDGLIAATALATDLALATRNTKDFAGLGVKLIDPWQA